jgi:hypothetical protein
MTTTRHTNAHRPGSLGQELEQQRRKHRIRRIQMSLSSLHTIAASHEGSPPRALQLSIADFERQLEEALGQIAPLDAVHQLRL